MLSIYVLTGRVHSKCKSPITSPEEAEHFLKFRLFFKLKLFPRCHGRHPQEHETLMGLCFPAGGSQLRVSQGFRQGDVGMLDMSL
jgi:hypothetical protein